MRVCLWFCGGRPARTCCCLCCLRARVCLPACLACSSLLLVPGSLCPCIPVLPSPACLTPASAPPAPPLPNARCSSPARSVSARSISGRRVPVRRPLLCSWSSSRAGSRATNPGASARVGGARLTRDFASRSSPPWPCAPRPRRRRGACKIALLRSLSCSVRT